MLPINRRLSQWPDFVYNPKSTKLNTAYSKPYSKLRVGRTQFKSNLNLAINIIYHDTNMLLMIRRYTFLGMIMCSTKIHLNKVITLINIMQPTHTPLRRLLLMRWILKKKLNEGEKRYFVNRWVIHLADFYLAGRVDVLTTSDLLKIY